MNAADLVVGETYLDCAGTEKVVLVSAKVDSYGYVVVLSEPGNEYAFTYPSDLTPILKRYTVELREAVAGDAYLAFDEARHMLPDSMLIGARRFVIVDGPS